MRCGRNRVTLAPEEIQGLIGNADCSLVSISALGLTSRIWSFLSSTISPLSCSCTTYVSVFLLIGTSRTLAGSKLVGSAWDGTNTVVFCSCDGGLWMHSTSLLELMMKLLS